MLALTALEISFLILVGVLTLLSGLFAVYVVIQHFRNPVRRWSRPRR
jgi:hypothetical protein